MEKATKGKAQLKKKKKKKERDPFPLDSFLQSLWNTIF